MVLVKKRSVCLPNRMDRRVNVNLVTICLFCLNSAISSGKFLKRLASWPKYLIAACM